MENASDALHFIFGVFIFMLACVLLFLMVDLVLNVTTDAVLKSDKAEYFTYVRNPDDTIIDANGNRIVTLESIIPALYRYAIESYAVTIIDKNGDIVTRFSSNTESLCANFEDTRVTKQTKLDHIKELNKWVLEPTGSNLLTENLERSDEILSELFKRIYGNKPYTYNTNRTEFNAYWLGNDAMIAQRVDSDLSRNTGIFR